MIRYGTGTLIPTRLSIESRKRSLTGLPTSIFAEHNLKRTLEPYVQGDTSIHEYTYVSRTNKIYFVSVLFSSTYFNFYHHPLYKSILHCLASSRGSGTNKCDQRGGILMLSYLRLE